jgi:hypothetical protein
LKSTINDRRPPVAKAAMKSVGRWRGVVMVRPYRTGGGAVQPGVAGRSWLWLTLVVLRGQRGFDNELRVLLSA